MSDTEVKNDIQTNEDETQGNTDDETQSCDSGTDNSDSENVCQSSSFTTTTAPFAPPPFTAEAGPNHNLPGTTSVEEFFLVIFGENFF